jgi:hypothetical protein
MMTTTLILTLLFSNPQAEKFEKQKLEVQALIFSTDLVMEIGDEATEIVAESLDVFVNVKARKAQSIAHSNSKEFPTGFT